MAWFKCLFLIFALAQCHEETDDQVGASSVPQKSSALFAPAQRVLPLHPTYTPGWIQQPVGGGRPPPQLTPFFIPSTGPVFHHHVHQPQKPKVVVHHPRPKVVITKPPKQYHHHSHPKPPAKPPKKVHYHPAPAAKPHRPPAAKPQRPHPPVDTRPHQPKYIPNRPPPTVEFPDEDVDDASGEDGGDPFGQRDYFPPPNIVGLLEDEGATTLLSLLEQADLLEKFEKKGSYTLFAPTNEAFARLDRRVIEQLADDVELLESVLK